MSDSDEKSSAPQGTDDALTTLREKIRSTEDAMASIEKEKDALRGQLTDYEQNMQTYNSLKNTHTDILTQHGNLERTHGDLNTKHRQLTADHAALDGRHKQLTAEHTKLMNEHSVLSNSHNELTQTHAAHIHEKEEQESTRSRKKEAKRLAKEEAERRENETAAKQAEKDVPAQTETDPDQRDNSSETAPRKNDRESKPDGTLFTKSAHDFIEFLLKSSKLHHKKPGSDSKKLWNWGRIILLFLVTSALLILTIMMIIGLTRDERTPTTVCIAIVGLPYVVITGILIIMYLFSYTSISRTEAHHLEHIQKN